MVRNKSLNVIHANGSADCQFPGLAVLGKPIRVPTSQQQWHYALIKLAMRQDFHHFLFVFTSLFIYVGSNVEPTSSGECKNDQNDLLIIFFLLLCISQFSACCLNLRVFTSTMPNLPYYNKKVEEPDKMLFNF